VGVVRIFVGSSFDDFVYGLIYSIWGNPILSKMLMCVFGLNIFDNGATRFRSMLYCVLAFGPSRRTIHGLVCMKLVSFLRLARVWACEPAWFALYRLNSF